MRRFLATLKQLPTYSHKPWKGVFGSFLPFGLLCLAGAKASTDWAFVVVLLLSLCALALLLSWLLIWAGDAKESEKGRATLLRIDSLSRFLGFAALLTLAILGLKPHPDTIIGKILVVAGDPGLREKVVSGSTVVVRTAENSLSWPQATVLTAVVFSITAVVVALIFAIAQYFRD